MSQFEELIFKYFDDGFWYKEILEFLIFVHGYSLSLSSLKRILRRNNKKRRALRCSQQELSNAVERKLAGSSNNVGYCRRMHLILISKSIQCRRKDVRKMVCDKDPESFQVRKRRRLRCWKYTSPLNVKADDGTKHSLVQPIHLLLRKIDGSDPDLESFSVVTSPVNQRIEKLDGGNGFFKIW